MRDRGSLARTANALVDGFRDAKKKRVKEGLFHLCDDVQSVVETSSPADATALVESAFMSVRRAPKRVVPEVSAKNGDVSG